MSINVDLPEVILQSIFGFLSITERHSLCRVSKCVNQTVNDPVLLRQIAICIRQPGLAGDLPPCQIRQCHHYEPEIRCDSTLTNSNGADPIRWNPKRRMLYIDHHHPRGVRFLLKCDESIQFLSTTNTQFYSSQSCAPNLKFLEWNIMDHDLGYSASNALFPDSLRWFPRLRGVFLCLQTEFRFNKTDNDSKGTYGSSQIPNPSWLNAVVGTECECLRLSNETSGPWMISSDSFPTKLFQHLLTLRILSFEGVTVHLTFFQKLFELNTNLSIIDLNDISIASSIVDNGGKARLRFPSTLQILKLDRVWTSCTSDQFIKFDLSQCQELILLQLTLNTRSVTSSLLSIEELPKLTNLVVSTTPFLYQWQFVYILRETLAMDHRDKIRFGDRKKKVVVRCAHRDLNQCQEFFDGDNFELISCQDTTKMGQETFMGICQELVRRDKDHVLRGLLDYHIPFYSAYCDYCII